MPYSADLRHSYAKTEVNSGWVLEVLNDNGMEINWKDPIYEDEYLLMVDIWVNEYLKAKVFWTGKLPEDTPKDILNADSIWTFIYERSLDYFWKHSDEIESEESDDEDD